MYDDARDDGFFIDHRLAHKPLRMTASGVAGAVLRARRRWQRRVEREKDCDARRVQHVSRAVTGPDRAQLAATRAGRCARAVYNAVPPRPRSMRCGPLET